MTINSYFKGQKQSPDPFQVGRRDLGGDISETKKLKPQQKCLSLRLIFPPPPNQETFFSDYNISECNYLQVLFI